MSRYHKFLNEIDVVLKHDKSGKANWRIVRIRILKRVVKDLIDLKQLPPNWHNLNNNHIFNLINYWRRQKLTESTITTYLAAIRYFFDKAKVTTPIATNKELGIDKEYSKSDPDINAADYSKLLHPYIKCIFGFELFFGLHRIEAIKIKTNENLIFDDKLWITRNIAFNGIERLIPIVTTEQIEVIKLFKATLENHESIVNKIEQRALMAMYKVELANINLKPNKQHRKHYVKYRAKILEELESSKNIRNYIKNEMGIKSNNLLLEYMA